MKKNILVALLAGALLASCAMKHHRTTFDPTMPTVGYENGQISVSPDPLLFFPDKKNVEIVWRVPEGSALRFAEKGGIEIDGVLTDKVIRGNRETPDSIVIDKTQDEIVDCKVKKPGLYKYTIRLLDNGRALPPKDPTVMNM